MTTTPFRRARGTKTDAEGIFVEVSSATKTRLDRMVAATGAPKWAVVEYLINHTATTDDGLPQDWPHNVEQQGELPITRVG